jgi:hypothetical protein
VSEYDRRRNLIRWDEHAAVVADGISVSSIFREDATALRWTEQVPELIRKQ